MILTASDVIKASFRKLGLLAKAETPSAEEMNDALQSLNIMIDEWGAQKLMGTANTLGTVPLVPGKQAYTVGIGGYVNMPKPFKITYAYYLDINGIKTTLDVVTREEWFSYEDSQIVDAPPLTMYYDPGTTQQANQLGTIYVYYTPDASNSYTLYFDAQIPFTEFITLTDTVTFPPSYYKALVYNLAVELAPEYGVSVSEETGMLAMEAKETVEATNSVRILASNDLPKGRKGTYNWISDNAE